MFKNVDLENLGQCHGFQHAQWCHSMTNINVCKRHIPRFCACSQHFGENLLTFQIFDLSEAAHWRLYRLPVVAGDRSFRKVVRFLGPGSLIRRYTPRYTNSPKTAFVPEGTVVASGGCFVKILRFFLIILARLCF